MTETQPHRLLSLSGRIIEVEYRFCEMSVPEFLRFARECDFDAVELRATQLPAETTRAESEELRRVADELGLGISCCIPPGVTAEAAGLQRLEEFAGLACALDCEYLKVWISDVDWLRRACDRLQPYGLTLLAQTHTGGPFETIASCLEALERIGRENFGLQYDPANLFEAQQEYGEAAVRRLGPHLRQLSVQSVCLARPDEPDVWEHAGRCYRRCLLDEPGALDYAAVFRDLRAIGFEGYITLNEPKPTSMGTPAFVKRMQEELRMISAFVT
jgi:sugar phosphate isomerase/epimerase